MSSATLVLSWLVLCHLLADFVLQPEWVAVSKFGRGSGPRRALLIHTAIVAAVASPIVLVYGVPGVAYVLVTAITHVVIDQTKIELTLRKGPGPGALPGAVPDVELAPEQLPEWSPMPGAWFLLDQLAHLGVLVVAWALLLAGAEPLGWWQDLVARIAAQPDGAEVGRAVLVCLVIGSLLIANVRAGSLFVATLVRAPRPPHVADARPVTSASVARIGATIGVAERLLIAALVLAGGIMTIGLVVAAKTLARFKQLDDRDFAEYYLLGTLASVTFAVVTSLVAARALA